MREGAEEGRDHFLSPQCILFRKLKSFGEAMARRGGFIDGISLSRRKRLRNRSAILRRSAASASAEGWHRTTELREGGIKRRARGGTAHFKRERERADGKMGRSPWRAREEIDGRWEKCEPKFI